jgi:hypothetical protein
MTTIHLIKKEKGGKKIPSMEVLFISLLSLLLIVAVYFTSAGTNSKAPTGYATTSGLALNEIQTLAQFDINLLSKLPFLSTKEEGTINLTKYGAEEQQKISLHYLNEDTAQELYIVYSQLEKDLLSFTQLQTEAVKLPNGIQAKYGTVEYGEGLTWTEGGIFYGIYHHVHRNQPKLGLDTLAEMAADIMRK